MTSIPKGKHYSSLLSAVTGVSLLLLLVFLIPSVSALPLTDGTGMVHDQAIHVTGAILQDKEQIQARTISAVPVITVRPTPTPARQNRTSLLQTLVKNAAERPRVTLPASLFILIVAIAFIGLGAILYFLIRRRTGSTPVPKKLDKEIPGHTTVTGSPAAVGPEPEIIAGNQGNAVQFPKALEKRFLNPEFIGEGGLARVFRAKNAKTMRTVAVKVPIRDDEITGTHFTKDIVFSQGPEHENIIRIFSSNILPVPYIEMEYAPSSLAALSFPLPEEKAVSLVLGIARGLAYAHARGIMHRDIKPENILLAEDGTPKITDWGLGKALTDTRKSSMIGFSPSYAAPEQIAPQQYGKPGPATDIYQLGMLLYEMLTGSVAFEYEGLHDLHLAILNNPPQIPSWDGRHVTQLKEIILKCLAKRPEDRYNSIEILIKEIESMDSPENYDKIR